MNERTNEVVESRPRHTWSEGASALLLALAVRSTAVSLRKVPCNFFFLNEALFFKAKLRNWAPSRPSKYIFSNYLQALVSSYVNDGVGKEAGQGPVLVGKEQAQG